MSYKKYISMARPGYWTKNIFVLPGVVIASVEMKLSPAEIFVPTVLGLMCVCLVASANYVINEVLDAKFDQYHPTKKFRAAVSDDISLTVAYSEYALLLLAGIGLGWYSQNGPFVAVLGVLALCGVLYNVPPIRLKDRVYLDVLFESFNNVLRLTLGWVIVAPHIIPPCSLEFSFWMAGAFLMAAKRYAEYRFIADPERAGLYRRSFRYYSEDSLLISCLFYAINFSFFFGIFLYKYRLEYILLFPLFSFLFAWYLRIAMRPNSVIQTPGKLFKEKQLNIILLVILAATVILTYVDMPKLELLLKTTSY